MKRLLTAIGLACGLLGAARADDWTQFRGSNRDAAWNETGLLATFPAGGLKVRWRVPAGGGFSSPVIADGRVWLIDALLQQPRAWERIRCIDEKTGDVLWSHIYEVTYEEGWFRPGMKDGPRATPAYRDGKLYAVGSDSDLHCLDARTGKVIWRKTLKKEYDLNDHRCV